MPTKEVGGSLRSILEKILIWHEGWVLGRISVGIEREDSRR